MPKDRKTTQSEEAKQTLKPESDMIYFGIII